MLQWGASDEEVHGRDFSDHRPAGKGSKVSPPTLDPREFASFDILLGRQIL